MSEMLLRVESLLFEPQSLQTNFAIAQHDAVGHPLFLCLAIPQPALGKIVRGHSSAVVN